MIFEFFRWNMHNVFFCELILESCNFYSIYKQKALQSPRGHDSVMSLVITFTALLATYFNFSWLLSLYSFYLALGIAYWCYNRFYFYSRRTNSIEVAKYINEYDYTKVNYDKRVASSSGDIDGPGSMATLKPDKHSNGINNLQAMGTNYTNSLTRQRVNSYKQLQRLIVKEPRIGSKHLALSLNHLSNLPKWMANEDVFDEMHIQVLATRRDVLNILLRTLLLCISLFLIYFR